MERMTVPPGNGHIRNIKRPCRPNSRARNPGMKQFTATKRFQRADNLAQVYRAMTLL